MANRKIQKQSAKATLAEAIKEMAKPRVAASAREHRPIVRKEVLVVENDVEKGTMNLQCVANAIINKP
jgi:hypothetical protein